MRAYIYMHLCSCACMYVYSLVLHSDIYYDACIHDKFFPKDFDSALLIFIYANVSLFLVLKLIELK